MVRNQQSGSVYLILVVATLLFCFVGTGIYFISQVSQGSRKFADKRAAYDSTVALVKKTMADPASIDLTLRRNASAFQCLFTGSAECHGQGGPFLLYRSTRLPVVVSHLARGVGLNLDGVGCTGYPSEACPLRVDTVWQPVCNNNNSTATSSAYGRGRSVASACANTRSIKMEVKVTLATSDSSDDAMEWSDEQVYTPKIQLSAAALCERKGGVWGNSTCLNSDQLATATAVREDLRDPEREAKEKEAEAQRNAPPVQPEPPHFECPGEIMVQGHYYPVQFIAPDRAQVSVPAMSCTLQGASDVFVFLCSAVGRQPASDTGEGQWVQVEAVMAPACDSHGNPVSPGADPRDESESRDPPR